MAAAKGEALFSIIARGEFDLVGMVPTRDIQKLQVNQTARIKLIGAGEVDGKVRRLSTTVEPNSQLAQVFLGVTTNRRLLVNSSGRAQIKTGQSCGVSVPLTAILYGSAGTVVQVVRRARVETRRAARNLCREDGALPLPLAGEGWGGGCLRNTYSSSGSPAALLRARRPKSE